MAKIYLKCHQHTLDQLNSHREKSGYDWISIKCKAATSTTTKKGITTTTTRISTHEQELTTSFFITLIKKILGLQQGVQCAPRRKHKKSFSKKRTRRKPPPRFNIAEQDANQSTYSPKRTQEQDY